MVSWLGLNPSHILKEDKMKIHYVIVITSLFLSFTKIKAAYIECQMLSDVAGDIMINPYTPKQLINFKYFVNESFVSISSDYGNTWQRIVQFPDHYYEALKRSHDPFLITGEDGKYIMYTMLGDTVVVKYSDDYGKSFTELDSIDLDYCGAIFPSRFDDLYTKKYWGTLVFRPKPVFLYYQPYCGIIRYDFSTQTSELIENDPPDIAEIGTHLSVYPQDDYDLVLLNMCRGGLYGVNNQIWWSTDAGETWQCPISNPIPEFYNSPEKVMVIGAAINPNNLNEIAMIVDLTLIQKPPNLQNEVLYTTDGGFSWNRTFGDEINPILIVPNVFYEIFCGKSNNQGNIWYYKTYDNLYYTNDLKQNNWQNLVFQQSIPDWEIRGLGLDVMDVSPASADTFFGAVTVKKLSDSPSNYYSIKSRMIFRDSELNLAKNNDCSKLNIIYSNEKIVIILFNSNWSYSNASIFNLQGEFIYDFHINNPCTSIKWSGKDKLGNEVPMGIYFIKVIIDNQQTLYSKLMWIQ
jgi:hypothetical protein